MTSAETYQELAEAGWAWTLAQLRDDDGPWLPVSVDPVAPTTVPPADRDSLYDGIGGLALTLAEIRQTRAWTTAEGSLADGIAARLTASSRVRVEPSLYDGLAGDATALRLLSPGAEQPVFERLLALATATGWPTAQFQQYGAGPVNDVIGGTAGIVLAALWAGGEHSRQLVELGCAALLEQADPTPTGLDWRITRSWPGQSPNFSHGTAGVASALAVAGAALDRQDLLDAARLGAAQLLAVGSLDGGGFVVPHTIPESSREVEPVTYTWCHGPAGTSQLFAALATAGIRQVEAVPVEDLRRRCLHAILAAGVPQRLRPGFWDNDGRCCGTAGVGDVFLDAAQDAAEPHLAGAAEPLAAARLMGDALVERAEHCADGACWRFVEYRQDPPLLPPGTGWMQGAAGIAAFLFRLARVATAGLDAVVVDRPDQWWAVPTALRLTHPG